MFKSVVAITGGSSGIGRATALRLARDGAAVGICARRRDRLDEVAAAISRAGGEPLPVVADVTRAEEVANFIAATIERFGRLDVVMCNAGFGVYGSVDAIRPSQMEQLMATNFLGTYYTISAALPSFRQQGHGHVVVLSSIVGKRGVPYMGAYSASKFAQVGLAECLRAEFVGTDIHVTLVFPISTDTEFFQVMTSHSGFATRALGPRQSAEAVAEAIALAVRHPVPEVYPYRKARGLVLLNAIAPGVCDRLVRRWGRTPI